MSTSASAQGRDLHVVERVLRGDAEVYRVLVERYRAQALAHAHAMTGDPAVAEAAVDEAFLMAFHALAKIVDRSNFRPFCYRALRKKLALAADSARPTGIRPEDEGQLASVFVDGLRNVDAAPVLRQALLGLRPDLREAWSLRHVAGLPLDEIASLLGVGHEVVDERVREAERVLLETKADEGASPQTPSPAQATPTIDDVAPPALLPELEDQS